jgi:hypothetical protein
MLSGSAGWLNQTVTIYPYSTLNDYAEYSWGTGVSTACRIEQTDRHIMTEDGKEIVAAAKIFVDGTTAPNIKDKVVLPNGDDRLIERIENMIGPDGNSYYKVLYV